MNDNVFVSITIFQYIRVRLSEKLMGTNVLCVLQTPPTRGESDFGSLEDVSTRRTFADVDAISGDVGMRIVKSGPDRSDL